jgi:predicted neutral ceramidase superfamily lipid hydrolase
METEALMSFLKESLYLIVVFGVFMAVALIKGKQALINIILGLYFALLFTLEFPYYDRLFKASSAQSESLMMLAIFVVFAIISILLFNHLMPREFSEKPFEGLGKKILFASGATVLVMAFSFHALPITEFLSPGTPIQYLFAPEQFFFWWLSIPIVVLFLL